MRRSLVSSPAVIVLVSIMLGACASLPITRLESTDEPWTNYTIGREQRAPTGSAMVEWIGRAHFLRGYVMVTPVEVVSIGRQPPRDDSAWGARYAYHGSCAGGRYVITNRGFYREAIGIIVAADGTIPCEASVLQIRGAKRGREWRTPNAVGTRAFVPAPFFADRRQAPIKWELIYTGRSGDEITLAYREYAAGPRGTFARPAFRQTLTYGLSTSDRVVFRSMELEIIEASSAGVRFRVVRDPARFWFEPSTLLAPHEP